MAAQWDYRTRNGIRHGRLPASQRSPPDGLFRKAVTRAGVPVRGIHTGKGFGANCLNGESGCVHVLYRRIRAARGVSCFRRQAHGAYDAVTPARSLTGSVASGGCREIRNYGVHREKGPQSRPFWAIIMFFDFTREKPRRWHAIAAHTCVVAKSKVRNLNDGGD